MKLDNTLYTRNKAYQGRANEADDQRRGGHNSEFHQRRQSNIEDRFLQSDNDENVDDINSKNILIKAFQPSVWG